MRDRFSAREREVAERGAISGNAAKRPTADSGDQWQRRWLGSHFATGNRWRKEGDANVEQAMENSADAEDTRSARHS